MQTILFDLCAIPVLITILVTCFLRRITKDRACRVFIMMTVVSLACTLSDIAMVLFTNPPPLTQSRVVAGSIFSYAYLMLRSGTVVLYLIYLFYVTKTGYRIRSIRARCLLWLPNFIVLLLLLQNVFTHNVFRVTAEEGYSRGPVMMALYAIAALYVIAGVLYGILVRKYLVTSKWTAIIFIYVMTVLGVLVQMLRPAWLIELFFTAIGLLIIMLLVIRPEESIDASVNISSWKAYQEYLRNILLSGQHVQIVVIRMSNASEIRNYLGEDEYNRYVMAVADEINRLNSEHIVRMHLYFERPGAYYLILEDTTVNVHALIPPFIEAVTERIRTYMVQGVRFVPAICVINCPEDLRDFREIINLGHKFEGLCAPGQNLLIASQVTGTRAYELTSHMEEILNRVITEGTLEMHYQPIFCMEKKRFRSAEALARVNDPVYGMISPGLFIPAAEATGLILPMGERIMESVYRFISENDLKKYGVEFIEINLSVAQCLKEDLPDIVARLQKQYHVDPSQVNFEVTESLSDNISSIMDKNLEKMEEMGYTFSLDDYGVGYSNIQRMSKMPVEVVKIDKSLVDEMFTENGSVIFKNTVTMLHGIHKKLVIEGVETREELEVLADLSCDYIQGFYYSRPLPEREYLEFLEKHGQG